MEDIKLVSIGETENSAGGASIKVKKEYLPALKGLNGFSHIQVVWWFNETDRPELRRILEMPKPYRSAPEVMGIFATRSPIRPNPVALTVAEVTGIDYNSGIINVSWLDANPGSPVLDIKPYTPSADRVEAPRTPGWCSHWPDSCEASGNFDWENEFNF